jgi:hypothetical protein
MSPTNRPLFCSNQESSGVTDNLINHQNEDDSRLLALAARNRYIPPSDQVAEAMAAARLRAEIEAEAEADEIIRRINAQVVRNRQIEIAANNRLRWELHQQDGNQHQMG